jgi:hypothetical protein
MIVDMQGDEPPSMGPDRFFAGLQVAARYIIAGGLPFFTSPHLRFMRDYVKAWRQEIDDKAVEEASADLDELRKEVERASADLDELRKKTRHSLSPVVVLLGGFLLSAFSSAWMVLGKSSRIVPPLITAVVVVFVTSDAWRLLGTGFTPRTICLVALFLAAGLVFLIRFKGYWEDDWEIPASGETHDALLRDICYELGGDQEADGPTAGVHRDERDELRDGADSSSWRQFHELIVCGAKTVPLVKPVRLRSQVCLYGGYLAVSAFSLIVVASVVSASLILVGLILISADQTSTLAAERTAHIYWKLPGNLVITRELVSLSLCLGALAVLFLVAGQRTEDRTEFMDNVLAEVRRIFVVYSVYCRAHDNAEPWTKIRVEPPPDTLAREGRQRPRHGLGVRFRRWVMRRG